VRLDPEAVKRKHQLSATTCPKREWEAYPYCQLMKSYGLGWRLVFAAGFFPALAGSAMLALALWSATLGRNDPWMSLVGQHAFSAAGLQASAPDLYALWLLTVHLCGVNLAMSGATMSAVAWFALRDGRSWAWPFLWILIVWIGVNDAAALVYYRLTTGAGIRAAPPDGSR